MNEKKSMYLKYIKIAIERASKKALKREAKYDMPQTFDKSCVRFTKEEWDKAHEIQNIIFSGGEPYELFNRTIHFIVELVHQIITKNDDIMKEVSDSLFIIGTGDPEKRLK